MERRRRGASDPVLSRLGVGTARIGSLPGVWWVNGDARTEHDSIAAIHAARDAGANWVDTAQIRDRDRRVPIKESWCAVLELAAAGKARHGGLSNHRPDEVERALRGRAGRGAPAAVQRARGRRLPPRAPFAALDVAELRAELRAGGDGSVTSGALRFVLRHPAVTAASVGVRNKREGRSPGHLGSPP